MSENNRYHFLDSSRGIAAFIVLLAHTIKTFSPNFYQSKFSILWDSEAAVLYFFILSGFVLSESIRSEKLSLTNYFNFAFKRICRIYPAFIVVLIISYLLYSFYSYSSNSWLEIYWKSQPNTLDVIKQALLIKRIPNDPTLRILPHDWTLSIEILISFALPFLVCLGKQRSWLVLILAFVLIKTLPIDKFLFDFAIGVFISSQKEYLISAWKKINIWGHLTVIIIAAFLLHTNRFFPEFSEKIEFFMIHSKSWGLGLLLAILLSSARLQNVLTNKILILNGKISYSFYLTHFIVLGIIYKSLPVISVFPALILAFSIAFLTSVFLFEFVEKPWIQVGKKCFSRIKGE